MWSDSETDTGFLNFRTEAETAAEMIYRAKGKPLSVGISGGWGVGKSSTVKLAHHSLKARFGDNFVFVEFNAWLYQGFDDARAALMEVIADALLKYAEEHKKPTAKILDFISRVRWVRVATLAGRAVAAVKTGGLNDNTFELESNSLKVRLQ